MDRFLGISCKSVEIRSLAEGSGILFINSFVTILTLTSCHGTETIRVLPRSPGPITAPPFGQARRCFTVLCLFHSTESHCNIFRPPPQHLRYSECQNLQLIPSTGLPPVSNITLDAFTLQRR